MTSLNDQLKAAGGDLLSQAVPLVIPFLQSMVKNYFSATQPTSVATVTTTATMVSKRSDAIAALQTLLNHLLKLDPPLEADGWLGKKTEDAINQGIAALKAQGIS